MIAPTAPGQGGAASTDKDSLKTASQGAVTETWIANNGATEGDILENYAWTLGQLPANGDINVMLVSIGMTANTDLNHISSYALITLESQTAQSNVTMGVSSDDAIKVWLNGEVVHKNAINRGRGTAANFQEVFQVDLIAGDNLLLVKVSERGGGWGQFVGIDADVTAVVKPPMPKIPGPWLWMIAPTAPGQGGAASTDVDALSEASQGAVTEQQIATAGANEGDVVGDLAWTLGAISDRKNNVNAIVNQIGFASGDVNHHSSYALITLESPTAQHDVLMKVGSDDAIKVWLNGEVVHKHAVNRGARGFQEAFFVNLVAGDNLLLVKVSERGGGWSMFVGVGGTDETARYKPSFVIVNQATTPKPVVAASQQVPTITDTQLLQYYIPAGDYNQDGGITHSDTLTGPTSDVLCVDLSDGGGIVAAGSRDGSIRVWDDFSGEVWSTIPNAHSGPVTKVLFTGGILGPLISAGEDGYIRTWDHYDGSALQTVGPHTVTDRHGNTRAVPAHCVAIHRTNYKYLASGGADKKVRLWDRDTNTQRYALTGHTAAVTDVVYNDAAASNDAGIQVASGSEDTTIRLWRNDTGAHIRTFSGHTNAVTDIVFDDSDDTHLWSCSRDGTVRKWDTTDGSHTVEGSTDKDLTAIALDPSSDGFAVAGNGRLYFYTPQRRGTYEEDILPTWRQVWDMDLASYTTEIPGTHLVTAEGYDQTVGMWRRVDADINDDNQVTRADVDLVRQHLGKAIGDVPTNEQDADVDGNNKVDHNDVTFVMNVLHNTPGAPARPKAGALDTETALLHNYPNPFNPETWIPYQLATPAQVRLSIYAADGHLVRQLALGHQPAGVYLSRSRAAYWDGRNTQGEPVASGIYFYTLKAGAFSATRKMLILK